MEKEIKTMALPYTKTMVQRAQAAESRIMQNKQCVDPHERKLCERLKDYYTLALHWNGDALMTMTYVDIDGRVHCGCPHLIPYYVEMQREATVGQRRYRWSQIVRIYTFAIFPDGYKVGLRLDIPLMLMNPETPQAMLQCPFSGNLNVLPYDPYVNGHYLIMRFNPERECFMPDGNNVK